MIKFNGQICYMSDIILHVTSAKRAPCFCESISGVPDLVISSITLHWTLSLMQYREVYIQNKFHMLTCGHGDVNKWRAPIPVSQRIGSTVTRYQCLWNGCGKTAFYAVHLAMLYINNSCYVYVKNPTVISQRKTDKVF